MTPEEISKQAEKEKKKSNQSPIIKPEKIKKHKTYNAFSFYTYNKIYPKGINFMFWFLLCIPGITFLILYFTNEEMGEWMLYTGFTFIILFIIRWMIDIMLKLSTYSSYKNFISTLDFNVIGWESIGSYPNQLNRFYWSRKSSVEIIMKSDVKEEKMKYVQDALFLFITNANKKFYEAEIGRDGRLNWKNISPLKAEGSSNIYVIGSMYQLINEYLRSIQKEYYIIDKVKIEFDSNLFEVNPPPSSD